MARYAPANADGEKPYVTWKGWSSAPGQIHYATNLREALVKAYGSKGAKAGGGRRASPEDITLLANVRTSDA